MKLKIELFDRSFDIISGKASESEPFEVVECEFCDVKDGTLVLYSLPPHKPGTPHIVPEPPRSLHFIKMYSSLLWKSVVILDQK